MAVKTATYVFAGDASSVARAAQQVVAELEKTKVAAEESSKGITAANKRTADSGKVLAGETEVSHLLVRKSFGNVAGAAFKMGAGVVAAYASIQGVKGAVDATTGLAETTLKLHKNFGLAVDSASEWAGVAQSRGIQATTLTMGFKTLSTAVRNATEGIGGQSKALADLKAKDDLKFAQDQKLGASAVSLLKTRQAQAQAEESLAGKTSAQIKLFEELGISQADLVKHGNDLKWVVGQVSDGLARLPAGTDKAAIAAKLFGKNAQDMTLLVGQGSKALDEQLKLADKYGVTLHGKSVKSVEEMIQAQRENKLATLGLQISLGTLLIPTLTKGITAFDKFVAQVRDGTGEGGKFGHTVSVIASDMKPLLTVAEDLGKILAAQPHLLEAGAAMWVAWQIASSSAMLKARTAMLGFLNGLGAESAVAGAAAGEAYGVAAAGAAAESIGAYKWLAIGSTIGAKIAAGIVPAIGAALAVYEGSKLINKITGGGLANEAAPPSGATMFDKNGKVVSLSSILAGSSLNAATPLPKTKSDASVAAQALAVAKSMHATPKQTKALIEAGIVESGLKNLSYGDRDSVGFLQQRPSQGWTGLMNVKKAAQQFLQHAQGIDDSGMTAGQLAQAVQRSARPGAYDQVSGEAGSILGSGGAAGSDMSGLEAAASGQLAQTAAQKAAAARSKRLAAEHKARVAAHNQQILAASRHINQIIAADNKGPSGISGRLKAAAGYDTLITSGVDALSTQQRRDDRTTEDVTTVAGRDQRKSEINAEMAIAKQTLERRKKKAAAYQAAIAKLGDAIKKTEAMLTGKNQTHGPARQKIRDRIKSLEQQRDDVKGDLASVTGDIHSDTLDIGDMQAALGQVDADYAAAQPTASDNLQSQLDTIDLQNRAGDLTDDQAKQAKIDALNQSINSGSLQGNDLLNARAELGDLIKDQTQATDDNTQAIKDLQASIDANTQFAQSVVATENASLTRSLADLISGQIAGFGIAGRSLTPGSGTVARY